MRRGGGIGTEGSEGHDISSFDPKAPPPKTNSFWSIVYASRSSEESELADVLDTIGRPAPVILDERRLTMITEIPEITEARMRYVIEDKQKNFRKPKRGMKLGDGEDLVLIVEVKTGLKWKPIAKRYSQQNWINLEPGYKVCGSERGTDYNTIDIRYEPVEVH